MGALGAGLASGAAPQAPCPARLCQLGTDTPSLSSSQQSPLSVVMSLGMALLIFIIIGAFQNTLDQSF